MSSIVFPHLAQFGIEYNHVKLKAQHRYDYSNHLEDQNQEKSGRNTECTRRHSKVKIFHKTQQNVTQQEISP